jgi:hypothetical protein
VTERIEYSAGKDARPAVVLLAMLLGCLSGCATIRVQTDYDPAADFSHLHTYAWQPRDQRADADPRTNNDLLDGRVRAAVDRGLQARGYEIATDHTPDFRVAYIVMIDTKTDIRSIPVSYGWGAWGIVGTETYVDRYDEGTLLLDVIDTSTNKLIWRGSAAARVMSYDSPEENTQRVNEAVGKILERFPPR